MKVLIIEDEKIAADYLAKRILHYDATIEILAILESVSASVKWLSVNNADLIFCDIHLADDLSFKIFEQIQVITPIIFTTAYDQYAIRAFKLNSIDYLLKPINEQELFNSLEKFRRANVYSPIDLQAIKHLLNISSAYKERFLVNTGQRLKSVSIHEIAYFLADQKIVWLVTNDNQRFIMDQTLDKLERILEPKLFFRINRQFIIGLHSIQSIIAYSKSRVKIELKPACDKEAIVSFERSSAFKEWLNK